MLYNECLARFKQRMVAYGMRRLHADVEILRTMRDVTYSTCGMHPITTTDTNVDCRFIPRHEYLSGIMPAKHQMSNITCVYLATNGERFTKWLLQIQTRGYYEPAICK